jgi:hypothetical protein
MKRITKRAFYVIASIICEAYFAYLLLTRYKSVVPAMLVLVAGIVLTLGYVFLCMRIAWVDKGETRRP